MEHDAADELHIEMPHAERPLRGLAHHGKGLGQKIIERCSRLKPFLELVGLCPKLLVRQGGNSGLIGIDRIDQDLKALQFPFVLGPQYFFQN